jgi:hypothetical protein
VSMETPPDSTSTLKRAAPKMMNSKPISLPAPIFAGGTKAITMTPVVGKPRVVAMLFAELGEVYDGPVVQTQDLIVINITKEAVISRQAKVVDQLPPIAGQQRTVFKPVAVPPPEWWTEALIPLDDVHPFA